MRALLDVNVLALAVHRGGRLVTFNRAIPLGAVTDASEEHRVSI